MIRPARSPLAAALASTRSPVSPSNSTVEVVLRADAALYYDAVQPVMQAVTQAGIGKVNLAAFLPEPGPPNAQDKR